MKAWGDDWYKVMILLFPLIILFTLCKKQETAKTSKQPDHHDSTRSNVQELMLGNQTEIEESINRIMKLIKEKEAELKKAQQEINRKSAELKQREEQLSKIEIKMKKLRSTSYFILVIGLMLILVGIFLLLSRPKSETY